MHVNRIDIDSDAYGRNFLEIREYSDTADFNQFEQEYISKYHPFYVFSKIPVEDIRLINALGRNGFEFIEFQIREQLNLKKADFP